MTRVPSRTHRRGFTLTELLVVMGVLALLAVLTAVGVQKISRDSRVASAVNTVTSMLGAARAMAIRDNAVVVVAFRPAWDPANRAKPQQTEVVVAKWTGDRAFFNPGGTTLNVADRFFVADKVPAVRLPAGIKVAGPLYEVLTDDVWSTQAELSQLTPSCNEAIDYNRMIAVMFAPDGTLVTRNPFSSAGDSKAFIDFNRIDLTPSDNDPQDVVTASGCASGQFQEFWLQDDVNDESNLTVVPFLAIYDDRQARERKTLNWSSAPNILSELTGPSGFISSNSDRIHFNRYTGVAETRGQDQ